MKTYIEHFATLKQPYRDQAILNCANHSLKNKEEPRFAHKSPTLAAALMNGFSWSESPQGGTYWNKVHSNPEKYIMKELPAREELSGGYAVDFQEDGSIKVGCQHISLERLETILKKARQAKKDHQE